MLSLFISPNLKDGYVENKVRKQLTVRQNFLSCGPPELLEIESHAFSSALYIKLDPPCFNIQLCAVLL